MNLYPFDFGADQRTAEVAGNLARLVFVTISQKSDVIPAGVSFSARIPGHFACLNTLLSEKVRYI